MAEGSKDWSFTSHVGEDLRGVDLSGANLRRAILDRADLEDLKNFFLRWYGPNNAILTITGDIKTDKVLPLVQRYFGSIPRGVEVRKLRPMVPRLSSDIYTSWLEFSYAIR